jgi:hypothetical protein
VTEAVYQASRAHGSAVVNGGWNAGLRSLLGITSMTYTEHNRTLAVTDSTLA